MKSFHHGLLGAKDAEIVLRKSGIDKSFLVRMVTNSHGKERHIMTFLDKNVVRHFLIPFNLRLESTFTEDLEIVVNRLVKSFAGCKNPIKVEIKTEDVPNDLVQKVDDTIFIEIACVVRGSKRVCFRGQQRQFILNIMNKMQKFWSQGN